MIQKALEYLIKQGEAKRHTINGREYADKKLHEILEPVARPFIIDSLSGIVEYIRSRFDTDEALMVHIQSPREIIVFNNLNNEMQRSKFVGAEALIPHFYFDQFYDVEPFNIKIQSCFIDNEDKEIILKVVGNIKEDQVKTTGDDGISQVVTAKVGVATVADVKVPNPVYLKPYRTFVEVEQPESAFVFRMQDGPSCALFEADGGAWKLEAMHNIKKYLEKNLQDEINEGRVIIIA